MPEYQTHKTVLTARRLAVFVLVLGLFSLVGVSGIAQAQRLGGGVERLFAPGLMKYASYSEGLARREIASAALENAAAIEAFYASRGHEPLWTGSRRQLQQARAVIAFLEDSWTHGLNPEQYHVDTLNTLMEDPEGNKPALELVLTDAVTRYGQDITGMRVDPRAIRQRAQYWRAPLTPREVLDTVEASAESAVAALKSLAPQNELYRRLRQEMTRLYAQRETETQAGKVAFGHRTFYPGDHHRDVPALRARLHVSHDSDYGPESLYDDRLAQAVMKFQAENGLAPDGVIGQKTLALLNRGVEERIEQVVANMERLRWQDDEKPDRYILVNIPEQKLWAVEHGREAFQMPVIVGRPGRPTMSFTTMIEGVRFNPRWTVPMTIKTKDFLPKLQEDPAYLSEKGIEIYKGTGADRVTVDPQSVDWSKVTAAEMRDMRMVQPSGAQNALGRVRVLMPNDYDIYLHDTNTPEYFNEDDRALSSGCIRLSEPEKVAAFILRPNQDWSEQKMQNAIQSGKMKEVQAEQPLPVIIVYQSIWLGEGGRLVYGPDIYKQDSRLVKALQAANDYHIPSDSPSRLARDMTMKKQQFN